MKLSPNIDSSAQFSIECSTATGQMPSAPSQANDGSSQPRIDIEPSASSVTAQNEHIDISGEQPPTNISMHQASYARVFDVCSCWAWLLNAQATGPVKCLTVGMLIVAGRRPLVHYSTRRAERSFPQSLWLLPRPAVLLQQRIRHGGDISVHVVSPRLSISTCRCAAASRESGSVDVCAVRSRAVPGRLRQWVTSICSIYDGVQGVFFQTGDLFENTHAHTHTHTMFTLSKLLLIPTNGS